MSQHTPDRWETMPHTGIGPDFATVFIRDSITHQYIGQVESTNAQTAKDRARLMAAAPLLLEALEKAVCWVHHDPSCNIRMHPATECNCWKDAAFAAIAAATEEPS